MILVTLDNRVHSWSNIERIEKGIIFLISIVVHVVIQELIWFNHQENCVDYGHRICVHVMSAESCAPWIPRKINTLLYVISTRLLIHNLIVILEPILNNNGSIKDVSQHMEPMILRLKRISRWVGFVSSNVVI